MRSTSIGCLARKNKNYGPTHEALRQQVSKNVNGQRGGLTGPVLTPREIMVIGFAWACLLGFMAFAVIGTIAVL